MDDLEFLNVLSGKRVKLTLKNSSYLGVVQRINPNKTLVLGDVSGDNGCKYPGSKLFFGREILNVEFTDAANQDKGNSHDRSPKEHLNVEKFQPYKKTVGSYDDDEEENINFVVIDNFHEKFGSAVLDVKKQHVIGVSADGVEVFKHGRLCWLQIATKKTVYLFDVLLLGARAFKNGLSMILESTRILKIIHDCRAIAGCLSCQFGVRLTNVFDTQVADVMCFYSETGGFLPNRVSTLEEVVSIHLKVPSSRLLSLQMKSKLTVEERLIWQKRPSPLPLLKVMALSVIHLQPLRLVLVDNLMMDYMTLVDSYLNSSNLQPGELEHISMESVLELPKELRKLEQMCHERQEWAGERYPVTEQGLLARFNPRIQPPTQTSPVKQQQQKRPFSLEPATAESHSSTEADLPLLNPPTSPPRVDSVSPVDVHASPDSAGQAPVASTVLPGPLGVSRGRTQALMNTVGRGRPFGKELSSIPAFPAIGRGFLLQTSQAQIPVESRGERESPGRMETAPSCSMRFPQK